VKHFQIIELPKGKYPGADGIPLSEKAHVSLALVARLGHIWAHCGDHGPCGQMGVA